MAQIEFYPDYCEVKRRIGLDEETGQQIYDPIYSGSCGLQFREGGGTYREGNTYQSYPIAMIPDYETVMRINDKIVVTTDNGRKIGGTIEQYETCSPKDLIAMYGESIPERAKLLLGTTIWMKGGNDVIEAVEPEPEPETTPEP